MHHRTLVTARPLLLQRYSTSSVVVGVASSSSSFLCVKNNSLLHSSSSARSSFLHAPSSSSSLLFSTKSFSTSTTKPSTPSNIMNNPFALLRPAESSADVLTHSTDRYSGVTVPDTTLLAIETVDKFTELMDKSMQLWRTDKRRGLWIQVPITRSAFIPVIASHGFEFHHAQAKYVMMTCWLPSVAKTKEVMAEMKADVDGMKQQQKEGEQSLAASSGATEAASASSSASSSSPRPASPEPSMIPDYASHSLGVGCVVLNSRGEVLSIQEKFAHPLLPDFWKLPGGAIDRGEEIPQAAEREVFEETGVVCRFHSLVGFRHLLNFRFGTGDLYFIAICTVKDENDCTPVPQPSEISACKWWDVQEFLSFHSTRWFHDLIREPVLAEWKKLYPQHTLPPPPTPARLKELTTMPPHPQASEGKSWPEFPTPQPPAAGSSVGLSFSKVQSALGKVQSNFYVVAAPSVSAVSASASASASSGPLSTAAVTTSKQASKL